MPPSSCADGPCRVPPHPNLLAQFRAEGIHGTNESTFQSRIMGFGAPTGTIPGLNDGAIFPESHFTTAPSKSQMARAALERAPLRGVIRFVH
jgi:immune inhibitor A